MAGYYTDRLAAERLRRCYEIAGPAVQAYLQAEVEHLAGMVPPDGTLLELGCGYGRVLAGLSSRTRWQLGIDTSLASLRLAREHLTGTSCHLAVMDAQRLGLTNGSFDVVACMQNGISAFGTDPTALVREAVRIARRDGCALFASYTAAFWPQRLAWFEQQAAAGLIGPLDSERTGDGVIICRDGFRAVTFTAADFWRIGVELGLVTRVYEVAGVSLCCEYRR